MNQEQKSGLEANDFDFVENASGAVLENSPRGGQIILWGVILFLLLAGTWASFAELDEVTRGNGKVIQSSQLQVVQNLEGGILSEILVKEGDVFEIDIPARRLSARLSESEIARRLKLWKPQPTKIAKGYLGRYVPTSIE